MSSGPPLYLTSSYLPGLRCLLVAFCRIGVAYFPATTKKPIGKFCILGQYSNIKGTGIHQQSLAKASYRTTVLRKQIHVIPSLLIDLISSRSFQIQKSG